jgi:hypothetical protein
MKSNFFINLENSSLSNSNQDMLEEDFQQENDYNFRNFDYINGINSVPDLKLSSRDFLLENRNKIKFAIESFIKKEREEIFEIKTNKNYLNENLPNPQEKETQIHVVNQIAQIPFNLKKTLTILTETSEIQLNNQEEKFNSNNFFSTPTDFLHRRPNNGINPFKSSAVKSINSISNWQNSTSGGISTMKKSRSRMKRHYGLSLMSEHSIRSKSTLRKAEEFLECLRTMEDKEVEINNGTLNCYLMTDQTIGDSSHFNSKNRIVDNKIQINQAECFDIIVEKNDSEKNISQKANQSEIQKKAEKTLQISENFIEGVNTGSEKCSYYVKRIIISFLTIVFNLIFFLFVLNQFDFRKTTIPFSQSFAPVQENFIIPVRRKNEYDIIYHKNINELYN